MAIRIPEFDTSWMESLGKNIREGYERSAQGSILADLKGTSPEEYERAAVRAFRANQPELGLRLNNMALARREHARRGQEAALGLEWLKSRQPTQMPVEPPATFSGGGGPSRPPLPQGWTGGANYSPPTTPPAWPVGPRSEAPDEGPEQTAMNLPTSPPPSLGRAVQTASLTPPEDATPPAGVPPYQVPDPSVDTFDQRFAPVDPIGQQIRDTAPQGLPVRPGQRIMDPRGLGRDVRMSGMPETSEAILAAAQGGGAPPAPPGAQLAQAGGGLPAGALPPGVPTGAPPPMFGQPAQVGPQAAPEGPRVPLPSESGRNALISREIARLRQEIETAPRGAWNSPYVQTRRQQIENLARQGNLDKDTISYEIDQIQNDYLGRQRQTRSEWEYQKDTTKPSHEEALRTYGDVITRHGNAQRALTTIGQMKAIMNDRDFITGTGTEKMAHFYGGLMALTDMARQYGIPVPDLREIESMQGPIKSAALANVFQALSNKLVYEQLGSLGNQISTSDRQFIERAYPSLSSTKEGNLILAEILETASRHALNAGRAVQEYRLKTERSHGRLSAPEMNQILQEHGDKHRFMDEEGKLTERGRAFQERINELPGVIPWQGPQQPFFERLGGELRDLEQRLLRGRGRPPTIPTFDPGSQY